MIVVRPRLVFVSGWGTDARCWGGVLSALSLPAPPQCVSFGSSFDIPADSSDIVLIGWSVGAMLAIQAAVKHPLRGLILIAGTPRLLDQRPVRAMAMLLPRRRLQVLEDFARLCVEPGTSEPGIQAADFVSHFLEMADSMETTQLLTGLQYLRDTDLQPVLSSLAMPTVVVHGQADRVIPANAGQALLQGIAGASLEMIDDAGHALPFTHPQRIAQVIQQVMYGDSTAG